jgi:hypothetical protein
MDKLNLTFPLGALMMRDIPLFVQPEQSSQQLEMYACDVESDHGEEEDDHPDSKIPGSNDEDDEDLFKEPFDLSDSCGCTHYYDVECIFYTFIRENKRIGRESAALANLNCGKLRVVQYVLLCEEEFLREYGKTPTCARTRFNAHFRALNVKRTAEIKAALEKRAAARKKKAEAKKRNAQRTGC